MVQIKKRPPNGEPLFVRELVLYSACECRSSFRYPLRIVTPLGYGVRFETAEREPGSKPRNTVVGTVLFKDVQLNSFEALAINASMSLIFRGSFAVFH